MNTDNHEDLLDVFKAAALSVTKLYKTSATAQTKARADGYQDCLDDLVSFLDREGIGLIHPGEGWKIRRWATERLDGREAIAQTLESEEEEVEKAETASSPELHRRSIIPVQAASTTSDTPMPTGSARRSMPPTVEQAEREIEIVVPVQETFTFTSAIPYPQDPNLTLANLDLSDNRSGDGGGWTRSVPNANTTPSQSTTTTTTTPRSLRARHGGSGTRSSSRRIAGQKRKLNLPEIFDLGSIGSFGYEKDVFGSRSAKRTRHS